MSAPGRAPIVTLLTDFGTRDGYVGAVKGALLSVCPAAHLVDLTHDIPAGDVKRGAFVLAQAVAPFAAGTVHLAVVDPGVGSRRRALACRVDDQLFVAPDNGLLDRVLARARNVTAHVLENAAWRSREVSPVFHGRDVFAIAAARLAAGVALGEAGPALAADDLVRLDWPEPSRSAEGFGGCIVHVDGFGNLITNLPCSPDEAVGRVRVRDSEIEFARTYSDVAPGHLLALVGSSGLLEIACNGASAAERLGAGIGDVVTWRRPRLE